MNGNVAGGRIVLQAVQDRPAGDIGKIDIQGDGAGLEFARQRHGAAAAQGDQRFQAMLVGQIYQDAGERNVVFDNQQHRVIRLDQVAIIVDDQVFHHVLGIQPRRGQDQIYLSHGDYGGLLHEDGCGKKSFALGLLGGGYVDLRQIQCECASDARRALQSDFAA